jgi:diadenosine tetraphosphate (Ap4A) HIT family hydrolase
MNGCPMCRRWAEEPELRLAEFEHCRAVLNRDQFFPGYSLVFTRDHVTELFHLDAAVRRGVMEEVTRVAAALSQVFRPAKMNYELLGNMVPHMHWHLVPRFTDDPLWPRPIWSAPHEEKPLPAAGYRQTIERIRAALAAPGEG